MRVSRTARAIGLASLAYIVAALAYTWPLAIRLGGVPHDTGDPLLTTWFLWWSTQAVPLTATWWNAPMFHPATGVLGFSEHLLGLLPIALPFTLLTGQPLVGHNVALIATFVLSALGAHFLAYTLTRRHDVSAVAAVAFAFAPYRLPQLPHIQVLASFWTPVCLAALHRYDRTGRTRWAVAAAMAWVLQALSCGYYLIFLGVLVAAWVLWFAVGRWPVRRLAVALTAFAGGAVLLAPFVLGYRSILHDTYGFNRSIEEMRVFSADVASLLSASDELLVWGWVGVFRRTESNLFPGLAMVLLAGFGVYRAHPFRADALEPRTQRILRRIFTGVLVLLLVAAALPLVYGPWRLDVGGFTLVSIARADKPMMLALVAALAAMASLPQFRDAFGRRSALAFYLLAAFATWLLALGPDPTFMDERALYRAPYRWLMVFPGFDSLRVPARFWMMTLACLSVVAALAVHRLGGRARQVVVALALAGLLLDGWPRHLEVVPAPARRPSPRGSATRLDLPVTDGTDPLALYQQMFDQVPLFNGFSGYGAPHYFAMRKMLEDSDPRILPVLAARGPLGVVIDHGGDADGALRRLVQAVPGTRVDRVESDWSSYLLAKTPAPPDPPERSGTPIVIKSLTTTFNPNLTRLALDGKLDSRWSGGFNENAFARVADLLIELEAPGRVRQVVTDLGPAVTDYPERLQLDVSADGSRWETVFAGETTLLTYYAAVRHPKEVPLVFPVDRDNVRFIRLSQTAAGIKRDWSVSELHVLR